MGLSIAPKKILDIVGSSDGEIKLHLETPLCKAMPIKNKATNVTEGIAVS